MPAKKEKRQEFAQRYKQLSPDERLKVMNNIRTFIGEKPNMRNVNEISSYMWLRSLALTPSSLVVFVIPRVAS